MAYQLRRPMRSAQRGFTLIEIGIVTIILVVLVALAVPAINSQIIGGRVPSAGQDLAKLIVTLKQQSSTSSSATPYATLPAVSKLLANTNFKVSGNVVTHSLGDASGQVTLDPVAGGAGAQITVYGLHPSACPSLASTVSKAADAIEVGQAGSAGSPASPAAANAIPTTLSANVVKTPGGNYDASAAAAACATDGNYNYMRFYVTP